MPPVTRVDVQFRGVFFQHNPIGRFHYNQYRVLEMAGSEAVEMVRASLYPGHGYLSGALHDSVAYRPERASRGASFSGRGRVVQGVAGYEQVRRYGRKIEARYHQVSKARSMLRSWVTSNTSRIADKLTEGLA